MRALAVLALAALVIQGCDQMDRQARPKPYREGWSPQPLPAGTVGRAAPEPAPALTAALLARGRERYDIYCSPCHGRTGLGDGMIVRHGFPAPPSLHDDAARAASSRHLYDVITEGRGAMYPYAARVNPADRWAIVAYIRALQESRAVPVSELPDAVREALP